MSKMSLVRALFLNLVLSFIPNPIGAAESQNQLDQQCGVPGAVPAELCWALYGAPEKMLYVFPDVPGENTPVYTIVVIKAGGRVIQDKAWKPNKFVRKALDEEYKAMHRTTVLYRFDPRRKVPKEPSDHDEDIRRWLASEPICIAVQDNVTASGWYKDGSQAEVNQFLFGMVDWYMKDRLRKKQDQSAPEETIPIKESPPATEVRNRTGPRRGPFLLIQRFNIKKILFVSALGADNGGFCFSDNFRSDFVELCFYKFQNFGHKLFRKLSFMNHVRNGFVVGLHEGDDVPAVF